MAKKKNKKKKLRLRRIIPFLVMIIGFAVLGYPFFQDGTTELKLMSKFWTPREV